MRISDSQFGALLAVPALLVVIIFILYPLGYNIYVSCFQHTLDSPDKFVGLGNYADLLGDRVFWHGLEKSFIYMLGSTALVFTIGLIQGHVLSRLGGKRGSTAYRLGTVVVWAIPLIIGGLFWASMFNEQIGVVNYVLDIIGIAPIPWQSGANWALFSVIIADAWRRIPFMTVLVLAGLEGIPKELYEAAYVDGADKWDTFRNISLPMNRFSIIKGTVLSAMFSFRAVSVVFAMTGGGPYKGTYVEALYLFRNIYTYLNFGSAAAIGVYMLLLICMFAGPLLIYLVLEGAA